MVVLLDHHFIIKYVEVESMETPNVLNTIGYGIKEFALFIFNTILEVWHCIKIVLKDLFYSIVFCCVFTVLVLHPIYKQYNDFAKEKVDDSTVSIMRSHIDENLSIAESMGIENSTTTYLLAKDIPPMVKAALILELDPTFEENVGVDNKRILEGLKTLIRTQGSTVPEMDTIAQKVIENVFLTDVAGVDKICEKYIGAKYLTAKYSKDEIIEFYCNSASCGKDLRGLQEASYVYFKTDFNSLSLKQQVYLCALLIDSREKNEIILHKQALEKSESLLNKLESVGIITEEEYNKAKDEKIAVKNR